MKEQDNEESAATRRRRIERKGDELVLRVEEREET